MAVPLLPGRPTVGLSPAVPPGMAARTIGTPASPDNARRSSSAAADPGPSGAGVNPAPFAFAPLRRPSDTGIGAMAAEPVRADGGFCSASASGNSSAAPLSMGPASAVPTRRLAANGIADRPGDDTAAGSPLQLAGTLVVDGRAIGRVVAAGQARALAAPPVSGRAVDLRATPLALGRLVPPP